MNHVVLIGRITKDIDLRKTTSGTSAVSFTLAVNRRFVKDNEQSADFINCVAWKQTAEFMAQYAKKGALIAVNGNIQSRSYENVDKKVYVTEVVVNEVQLLESKKAQEEKQNEEFMNQGQGIDVSSDDLPF